MSAPQPDAPVTPAAPAHTGHTLLSVPTSVLGALQQILSLHPLSGDASGPPVVSASSQEITPDAPVPAHAPPAHQPPTTQPPHALHHLFSTAHYPNSKTAWRYVSDPVRSFNTTCAPSSDLADASDASDASSGDRQHEKTVSDRLAATIKAGEDHRKEARVRGEMLRVEL